MNQNANTDVKEDNTEQKTSVREVLYQESDTPLFLRGGSEGKKGTAQDEKDKTAE